MVTEERATEKTESESGLNANTLYRELHWMAGVINARMALYFGEAGESGSVFSHTPPDVSDDPSVYARFINYYELPFADRLVLALAVAPHVAPQLLDVFFTRNKETDRGYTEFGGVKSSGHSGFLPTGETAVFVLAGEDLLKRFQVQHIFSRSHFFYEHNILKLEQVQPGEPLLAGRLVLSEDYVQYLTQVVVEKPSFGIDFPAKRITTLLEWQDLVLDDDTMEQLAEIKMWLEHGESIRNAWGLKKIIKPGYKVLFHGPPGTGKTLAASLLGKSVDREVYRIDLSMVVSKYIGETEKNLEKVFRKAENKNWILFFDEADALFGKRTSVSDAHDKYANQEVSYLLQRLEDFGGLVILASNLKSNMDDAFNRRLQSVIYFPFPKTRERLSLWQKALSPSTELEPCIDLEQLAFRYELAGGNIVNIIQYSALMARSRNENIIRLQDLLTGIKKEYQKEGKTM